jgi:hypothetical protein
MALARHKLRYVGYSGHAQFPRITQELIRSLDAGRRAPFVAHVGQGLHRDRGGVAVVA